MPEGDTIHKQVPALRHTLLGQPLLRLEGRPGQRLFQAGTCVVQVEAVGKHCLLHLENDHVVRVHLGMHGRWHRTFHQEQPRGEVRLWLETSQARVVCLQPRDVEVFPRSQLSRHPLLSKLGPDLLGPEPDWEEIRKRALRRSPPDRPLGEVLLDQQIAAGLGNVYKNELCFLGAFEGSQPAWQATRGVSPWSAWQVEGWLSLFQRGRELMLLNLGGWPRTTTRNAGGDLGRLSPAPRSWVYDRKGKPCLRCRTSIVGSHQGLEARATYWCPGCQRI